MKDGFKFRGTFNPSCDDELNVEVKLPAQPWYLWVVLWILIVGEVFTAPWCCSEYLSYVACRAC